MDEIFSSFRNGDKSFLGGCLGTLEVTVLRAHALLLTDEEGENDCYCEFIDTNGACVGKTCIIESLNPDWDERHKRIGHDEATHAALPAGERRLRAPIHKCTCLDGSLSTNNTFRFRLRPSDATRHVAIWLWDEDPFGRDFNGEVRIDIRSLLANVAKGAPCDDIAKGTILPRTDETDAALQGKRAGDLGTLTYRYVWRPTRAADDETALKAAVQRAPMFGLPAEALHPSERRQWLPCAIKVSVLSCRWLLNRDAVGLSDPYVTVLGPDEKELYRTPVIDDTLCPDWSHQRCNTLVHLKTLEETNADITLQVWDADTTGSDFLGEVRLPVAQMMSSGLEERECFAMLKPRQMERDKVITAKAFLGAIRFRYELLDVEALEDLRAMPHITSTVPLRPDLIPRNTPFRVTVYLRSCSYLATRNSMDIPNPYVQVTKRRLNTHQKEEEQIVHSTMAFAKNVCPNFMESFAALDVWDVLDDGSDGASFPPPSLSETVLTFTVFNKCKMQSESNAGDTPIGTFSLTLLQLLQRVNYALAEEGQSDVSADARAVGVNLNGSNHQNAAAAAAALNVEGAGASGALYLWATVGLPPATTFPLSRCVGACADGPQPAAVSSFTIYVWGCTGLAAAGSREGGGAAAKPHPFVRVYLDQQSSRGQGPELLRTHAVEGFNPNFGTRGVAASSSLALTLPLSPSGESLLRDQLITFSVVDESPYEDSAMGERTVRLDALLQMAEQSRFRRLLSSSSPSAVDHAFLLNKDGNTFVLPYIEIELFSLNDVTKKAFKSLSTSDKALLKGAGRGGVLFAWVTAQ